MVMKNIWFPILNVYYLRNIFIKEKSIQHQLKTQNANITNNKVHHTLLEETTAEQLCDSSPRRLVYL